jgi:hypothetical protein
VAEPWKPPATWSGTTSQGLNAILNVIAKGMPDGRRYSNAPKAGKHAAWAVVQKHLPDKSEHTCREIIRTWLKTGLLYTEKYDDPEDRRERTGLFVDNDKRPT